MVTTVVSRTQRVRSAAADPREIVLTCPNCGAEVRVRKGDPAKTRKPYTCTCGTELEIPAESDDPLGWLRIA